MNEGSYGSPQFAEALDEMYRRDDRRGVQIRLLDGTSGCYVTVIYCSDFQPESVARAAGEAAAMFIDGFRRDYAERGDVYDPVKRDAKHRLAKLARP